MYSDHFPIELKSKETRPSILIQLENGLNDFFFISSTDPNLLRKKSVLKKKQKNDGLRHEECTNVHHILKFI